MKYFQTVPPEKFRAFARALAPRGVESVRLEKCLGRVLAADISSDDDLPPFRKATMDGYAVRALDITGASSSSPGYLRQAGEVLIGRPAALDIGPGECCRIATGAMLPPAADAVVMVEETRELPGGLVEVAASVAPGENVAQVGDDVARGSLVLPRGRLLRPADIGILAGIGRVDLPVFRRVRVAVLSTGDELVEPGVTPGPGQIRNINQYSLMAHAQALGCETRLLGIAPDDADEISGRISSAIPWADIVLVSGGSSVGVRDLTAGIIASLGSPGIIFHGASMKPGKPTILGMVAETIIYGLPGHPVSAMVAMNSLVQPAITALSGMTDAPRVTLAAVMGDNIHSRPGREEHVQVALRDGDPLPIAMPIFRASGMITAMTGADGYLVVPAGSEGVERGERVTVTLYHRAPH